MVAAGRPRIFVSQPIRAEAVDMLREVGQVEMVDTDRMLTRDELHAGLQRSDYVLAIGDWGIDRDMLVANRHLKGIACAYDDAEIWFDFDLATELGIPLTGLHIETFVTATADLTMAFLLALAWRIPEADAYTRAGKFRQEQSTQFTCTSVTGKTLGLIGLGKVGTLVVPRARSFGMKVVYTKRRRLDPSLELSLGVTWLPNIDNIMLASDFVSLHVNYNESSLKLVGQREFELMKPTAFFIQTARGRVIDEDALIGILRERRIAGAALDVYLHEPPVTPSPAPDPRFFEMDNVLLAPHMGGQTEASLIDLAVNPAQNLVSMIRGQRPRDLLNTDVWERRN
jgi:phosphoglycerate dehydrogenase-like enzyme